ncbi:hypothetical protein B2J93_3113 [Marssonina coronariae]|uniref:Uncharacterized protein n=1 Tax=Diplocarpon coronariae TaxID=2795749 RepID=A0A218YR56_9HELO|nr:hypothetical protein B2J93_3113 [Marssonina coronariae]
MQIRQFLPILGFAGLSQTKPSAMFVSHAASALDIQDFLISEVISTEVEDRTLKTWNRTLSFIFSDPNANTATKCASGWYKDSTADRAPYSYVYCAFLSLGLASSTNSAAPANGFSIWKFKTYTSPGEFELSVAHSFSDPVHYPPPYNYVEYFANVDISLQCSQRRRKSKCVSNGTIVAEITGISN